MSTTNKKYQRRPSCVVRSRKLIDQDEEFIQAFLMNRGVTADDVDHAFELLSKDGRKINKEDVKHFAEKFFHKRLSPKVLKFVNQWKEEITHESLVREIFTHHQSNMLLNKPMGDTPFEDAFEVCFVPNDDSGSEPRVPWTRHISRNYSNKRPSFIKSTKEITRHFWMPLILIEMECWVSKISNECLLFEISFLKEMESSRRQGPSDPRLTRSQLPSEQTSARKRSSSHASGDPRKRPRESSVV